MPKNAGATPTAMPQCGPESRGGSAVVSPPADPPDGARCSGQAPQAVGKGMAQRPPEGEGGMGGKTGAWQPLTDRPASENVPQKKRGTCCGGGLRAPFPLPPLPHSPVRTGPGVAGAKGRRWRGVCLGGRAWDGGPPLRTGAPGHPPPLPPPSQCPWPRPLQPQTQGGLPPTPPLSTCGGPPPSKGEHVRTPTQHHPADTHSALMPPPPRAPLKAVGGGSRGGGGGSSPTLPQMLLGF